MTFFEYRYDVVKSVPTAAPTITSAPSAVPTAKATPTGNDVTNDVGSGRTVSPTATNIRPTTPSPTKKFAPMPTTEPVSLAPVDVRSNSSSPSEDIQKPTTQYKVLSEMVLAPLELLDTDSKRIWIEVTGKTIHRHTVNTIGIESDLVEVYVELVNQEILEQVRMLMVSYESLRNLQQTSDPRIRIEFTTTIELPSEEEELDSSQIVSSAFSSQAQRKSYIEDLQQAEGGSHFENLENVSTEVDREVIAESPEASSIVGSTVGGGGDGGSSNGMYYVIAAVGGAFILLFATAMGVYFVKRKKSKESEKEPSHTTGTQDHRPLDRVGLEISTKSSTHRPTPTNYIGAMESREDIDDVSTLGDPYMGDAVNAVMDTDRTVGERYV